MAKKDTFYIKRKDDKDKWLQTEDIIDYVYEFCSGRNIYLLGYHNDYPVFDLAGKAFYVQWFMNTDFIRLTKTKSKEFKVPQRKLQRFNFLKNYLESKYQNGRVLE